MSDLSAYARFELGRIFATLLTLVVASLLMKLIQKHARLQTGSELEVAKRRGNFVLLKNLVLVAAVIVIGTIWASKIAGAALSLAAVAGAMLIVSKEFLANLLGSAHLTVSRLYRVGDIIEIDGIIGRVVDTDLLATTVSEMGDGSQLTSRTVAIPHSLLLVKPLRHVTATGDYMVSMLRIAAAPDADFIKIESALLRAGNEICGEWIEHANQHLRRIERRELMDLPSAELKVILQLDDVKETTVSLRYCCPPNQKVKVEQAILRRFLAYSNDREFAEASA